jgi:RNA polymerase sigma-70 factor (ECF subfamily)
MELRKKYYVRLVSYAAYLGCTRIDAEEVANDSLAELAVREYSPAAEPISNARAWLYRVAHNRAMLVLRDRMRVVRLQDLPDEQVVDPYLGPEKHVEWLEVLDSVRSLPESHRNALALSICGFSISEIATILGCSASAAKKRISRARMIIYPKPVREPSPISPTPTQGKAE